MVKTELTGYETAEVISGLEANAAPEELDRFKRFRPLLRRYADNAQQAETLDTFFFWWGKFIAYSASVRNPSVTGVARDDQALLAGYGLAGEGGEVSEVIKKTFFHDKDRVATMKPDRRAKLIEEWGDRFWYDGQLADTLVGEWTQGDGSIAEFFRHVIQSNMDKLTDDPRTR